MWTLYKINILRALKSGKYSKDNDTFATFLATEYDRCIKRGGDFLYGVPIINGNIIGMADVIKRALIKGQKSGGENFNLLQEIYPAAFDAYWNGAEMAPIPNPILRPLGWVSTPPAPGAVMNIGPNPITLAQSAAKQTALKAAAKALVDGLKQQNIDLPNVGQINVGETIDKIKKGEITDKKIKDHPAIKAGMSIYAKYEQAKKMKPGTGMQFKPSVKFPFPELPKRSKLIEAAKKKLKDEAVKVLEEQYKSAVKELIASTISAVIVPKYPSINQNTIKDFVKNKMDGKDVPSPLPPDANIPKIPTGDELQKEIESKIPKPNEIASMADYSILGKIPKIPNVFFIPPTPVFSPSTNILVDPFVNVAKIHLLSRGGTMMIMAQYPPPAPPGPAILQWNGYNVPG